MQGEYTGGKANEGKDGRSTKGSCEVNAVRKTPVRSSEVDRVAKREITQEVDHVTTDPLQGQPNCQPDRSRSKIGKCMDGPHKLVDSAEVAAVDVEMMKEDITTAAMYHHEGNELFAEDVEQHMAVLPEITTSTTEITIIDVQVGDPGALLSEYQGDLQQLI